MRQTEKSNFAILIFQVNEIDGELRELGRNLEKSQKPCIFINDYEISFENIPLISPKVSSTFTDLITWQNVNRR